MTSADQWATFLRQCLNHRIDTAEFQSLSRLLLQRSPIHEDELFDVLMRTRLATGIKWEPLIPLYIDGLAKLAQVPLAVVLKALLKYSSIQEKQQSLEADSIPSKKCYTLMTDIRVIQDTMLAVSTINPPRTLKEANAIFAVVVDWIQAVVSWHHARVDTSQQTGGLMGSADAMSIFESLGILLAASSGTAKGAEALSNDSNEALKIKLGQALAAYLPLCVEVSLPLRNRLENLQKDYNLWGEPVSKALEVSMMDHVNVNALAFEESVVNGPVMNSRAGLYVYLNAMLAGRPLVDDTMLLNFLINRYEGQYDVLIADVITAAFDVLSNAVYRNESSRTMWVFRSFLVNKLPSFFAAMLAASMVSLPPMELCINRALSRLDPNIFPSFPQMFPMQGNPVLSSVRQEFLSACATHKLIPVSGIERLLGENPTQPPPVGYSKDDLVAQINGHPERAEQLIGEIESTDGNAGAIVGAITEVMATLCAQRETMTLKNICNALSRRPRALDVMCLFRSPRQILQPLCALLDSWHWDEDQGESQPVYDEFGSVLMLVLTFKYKYGLRPCDLGVMGNDSFVLQLLERGLSSQKLEDLNEKQNKSLGAWIGALFIAGEISEETMSACSPQEFYLMVTTLFDQSLAACEAGKLEFDTLKAGFEYLSEPFLLPSLVLALTWLGNRLWETDAAPSIPLKTLQSLVNPSSISAEARDIHRTVLSITARSLDEQLQDVRARHPASTEIKPILDSLEPCLSFQQTGSSRRSELEAWTTHSPGGMLGSIRSTFQSLVLWSSNPDETMAPPSYTHRQLIAGIRMRGATRVLGALLEELKLQSEAGNGAIALDILTVMVCAPLGEQFTPEQNSRLFSLDPTPARSPILTLRDALFVQHDSVPKISEKDAPLAEVLVRLCRRVNALLTPSPHVPNLDVVTNILPALQLGVPEEQEHGQGIGLEQPPPAGGETAAPGGEVGMGAGGGGDDINQLLMENAEPNAMPGMGMGMGMDGSFDTNLDDIMNVAVGGDMAVGNPEYLDLDVEEMFQ